MLVSDRSHSRWGRRTPFIVVGTLIAAVAFVLLTTADNAQLRNLGDAARIDEIVPEGKFDIHADGGAWCYVGLRHSFCHGWASGPTTWLSRHVLGIEPVGVGFREVRIDPHLGNLEWAEGSFPTPYGVITVKHRKQAGGSVVSDIRLPKGIRRVK